MSLIFKKKKVEGGKEGGRREDEEMGRWGDGKMGERTAGPGSLFLILN